MRTTEMHICRFPSGRFGRSLWCPMVLAGMLLVVNQGCGGGTATNGGSGGAASSTGESGGFTIDLDGCGGFTAQDAAAFLGIPADNLEATSESLGENSRWCIFSDRNDSSKSVNFTLSRAASVEEAVTEFDQFRSHVQVAVDTLGKKDQSAHEVPGLGDEAIWTPVPGILKVRKGSFSLQINAPEGEELQVKIARKLIGA
jgi:hypothetical protein